jgi:hypothetical protein
VALVACRSSLASVSRSGVDALARRSDHRNRMHIHPDAPRQHLLISADDNLGQLEGERDIYRSVLAEHRT